MSFDAPNQASQFCRSCGRRISNLALACPSCGAPTSDWPKYSDKSRLVALLLCFFLGIFGAHRFYVGKIGTGLLQFFTVGGLGIWTLVDFILIAIGEFTDKRGKKVKVWFDQ
jgi:TM2 domain-containing membrane protein YozV